MADTREKLGAMDRKSAQLQVLGCSKTNVNVEKISHILCIFFTRNQARLRKAAKDELECQEQMMEKLTKKFRDGFYDFLFNSCIAHSRSIFLYARKSIIAKLFEYVPVPLTHL